MLKVLVTHAGEPVRKEELFASVWTGPSSVMTRHPSCRSAQGPRMMQSSHASRNAHRRAIGSSLDYPSQRQDHCRADGASAPGQKWRAQERVIRSGRALDPTGIAVFRSRTSARLATGPLRGRDTQDIVTRRCPAAQDFPSLPALDGARKASTATPRRRAGAWGTLLPAGSCAERHQIRSAFAYRRKLADADLAAGNDRDLGTFAAQDEITACVVQSRAADQRRNSIGAA